MIAQLRAELLKQRSTRTNAGLLAALLALVVLVVLLHGFAVSAEDAGRRDFQVRDVFGRAEMLGALFAALLGAMSITSEFRHGTVRPTFLTTPRRGRVMAAKVSASMLVGTGFGAAAAAVAAGAGSAVLAARGVMIQLDGGDFALLLAGSAAAAALWAAIGAGVGAMVRNQVPALVGLCTWLLFVESLLVGDSGGLDAVGRYLPGALGSAVSGQVPELAPGISAFLLALYAAAAAAAGSLTTARRDVA